MAVAARSAAEFDRAVPRSAAITHQPFDAEMQSRVTGISDKVSLQRWLGACKAPFAGSVAEHCRVLTAQTPAEHSGHWLESAQKPLQSPSQIYQPARDAHLPAEQT